MSYTSKSALVSRFGAEELVQLTDGHGVGDIDDTVLGVALIDADRFIDSYLRARYTLPLEAAVVADSNLDLVAANIVRYLLMGARATEEVRDRYKDALTWLRDVQAGRASLGESDPAPAAGPGRIITGQGESGFDWDSY